ncbi:hypothetical protein SAMN05660971_00895 [Halomonas cupida]|uniref:Uncharacterized protein n=1 Tax=Halomonas cupida TaxID=44933 RepID=A0A1M7BYN2_9GAMM|nr:hypothetical protein SAMN05660971_00895 [Halomonas cupida]
MFKAGLESAQSTILAASIQCAIEVYQVSIDNVSYSWHRPLSEHSSLDIIFHLSGQHQGSSLVLNVLLCAGWPFLRTMARHRVPRFWKVAMVYHLSTEIGQNP